MTRNSVLRDAAPPAATAPGPPPPARSLVLVGLMGAGKSAIGRRLAARLGLPFCDADAEIERAAGCSIGDFFAAHGEAAFRDGERRVIRRLLAGPPCVLATGGGAFMDPGTRAAIRVAAVSIWLRCPLATLVRRTAHRTHRPLLRGGDPEAVLARLIAERHPVYAEADIVVDCRDDSPEVTTLRVLEAVRDFTPPLAVPVALGTRGYEVLIGPGLLARAGAHLARVVPQRRAAIVTDSHVAALHLPALEAGLAAAGFATSRIVVPAGEASKSLSTYGAVAEALLASGVERRSAVVALGGGVVGDLAGFAAATVLRGLPFVQVPTTLLAQVDSSVGGKTGINLAGGKNLLGAFHQPLLVLADTDTLATLPARELRAGYAEIAKAGLIGDAAFFHWCETNAPALLEGDAAVQAEAVARACTFKARIVEEDEQEQAESGGRALLNLGHSFAHALEAVLGYDGTLLHGEAVGLGLVLAFRLSAALGHCAAADADRVAAHVEAVGLPAAPAALPGPVSVADLLARMRQDKKMREGRLTFVLARGIGAAFTCRDVTEDAVADTLRQAGFSG